MVTTFSSYLKAPVPQTIDQFDSSPLILPKKRSPSELYFSSYGESEGTPTPKRRKARHSTSKSGFSSDPSSPTFYSTPPSAQVPREPSMEESGDETDIYDQFDLGDFTKEEIRRYESMVGPGERLRDAAPPEKLVTQCRETAYQTSLASSGRHTKDTASVRVLPAELYELVSTGISNAIDRAISEKLITPYDGLEGALEALFMGEISAPTPQITQLIREHNFVTISLAYPNWYRKQQLRDCCHPSGSLKSAQKQYEQDVYDLARSLGLCIDEAERWVLKAREFRSEKDYDEDETEKTEKLLAKSNSEEAKQIQRYLKTLKDSGSYSAYDSIMQRFQFLGDEPCIDNIAGLREEIDTMETADKTKDEKAARKQAKKARIKKLRAQEARRQAEERENQRSNDPQAAKSEGQIPLTSSPKHRLNVQPLADQNKPLKKRKRKDKHTSELELLVQLEAPSEDHHKYQNYRVDRNAPDANSKKTNRKKAMGPQHSPFFQQSSGPKANKKDSDKKVEQKESFQPPMIQPPPADPPSTLVKKRAPFMVTSLPSDDSSPLSSLRSTPSLLSFGNKEVESDNKRIIQLSRICARSKSVALAKTPRNNSIDLQTPPSSPISLRDLNKRLIEGTIYQDGIALAKPEPPATSSVPKKPKTRFVTVCPFFAKLPSKKPKASDKVSCIPFPPLQSTSFGLVQERLCHDPFRLLIAVIFLNKTRGSVALPVFYELMERYPTPADLAAANQEDVVEIIQHLGLQNQRAKKCINLAKTWLERPPERGKRYRVLHYPKRNDGKDVRPDEIVGEEDERIAWEIGQLPGIGAYAIDSWRIFCRDELRGLPTGLPKELTPEAEEEELQKEWTRVLAGDKELRAYLRWRWLRNGWEWDPISGERKKADESELAKADKGGVMYEGDGGDMVMGTVEAERAEAVKAEPEVGEEDVVNESGELETVIAGTTQEKGNECEEITTPNSQHNEKEEEDSKATKDEPESGENISSLHSGQQNIEHSI